MRFSPLSHNLTLIPTRPRKDITPISFQKEQRRRFCTKSIDIGEIWKVSFKNNRDSEINWANQKSSGVDLTFDFL